MQGGNSLPRGGEALAFLSRAVGASSLQVPEAMGWQPDFMGGSQPILGLELDDR